MGTIVYGICGIGNGHSYRQMPLVTQLVRRHRVVVFAYGDSLIRYRRLAAEQPGLTVLQVAVPYLPGKAGGLDWDAAARGNSSNFWAVNGAAMAEAERQVGCPDLVVSDYEPVAAMFAYASGAPLVTLDQQSKFLVGDLPERLGTAGEHTPADEVARLRLFFPRADQRLACSFFPVTKRAEGVAAHDGVTLIRPPLRREILELRRQPSRKPSILVYMSAQQFGGDALDMVASALASHPEVTFNVFGRVPDGLPANATIHPADDAVFLGALTRAHGVICTAGHNLLSELAHLGIPALALPMPLYEQQLNAAKVTEERLGVGAETLTTDALSNFLANLDRFAQEPERFRGATAEDTVAYFDRWLA